MQYEDANTYWSNNGKWGNEREKSQSHYEAHYDPIKNSLKKPDSRRTTGAHSEATCICRRRTARRFALSESRETTWDLSLSEPVVRAQTRRERGETTYRKHKNNRVAAGTTRQTQVALKADNVTWRGESDESDLMQLGVQDCWLSQNELRGFGVRMDQRMWGKVLEIDDNYRCLLHSNISDFYLAEFRHCLYK